MYNLCPLDVEQAVQLSLKYLIFLKVGDFPKTYYFENLITILAKVYSSSSVSDFYQKNILQFTSLEDAYLTSRYLPKEFSKHEAKRMIEFADKLFKVLEKTAHEKLV